MKRSAMLFGMGLWMVQTLHAASVDHSLACDIVEEEDKIIRCTYSAVRAPYDRTVRFIWRSETTPQDDRERTFNLPAGHGSVYDYRYYYGRAPGEWRVETQDEQGEPLAATTFTIQ